MNVETTHGAPKAKSFVALAEMLKRSKHISVGPAVTDPNGRWYFLVLSDGEGTSMRIDMVVADDKDAAEEIRNAIGPSQSPRPVLVMLYGDELDMAVWSSAWWPECRGIAAAIRQERAAA